MERMYDRNPSLWLLCLMCSLLPAIAQEQVESPPPSRSGFSVRETNFYSTYYSVGLPPSLITSGPQSGIAGYDVAIGGSTTIGFEKPGERTNISMIYTPSYTGRVRYSDWSAFSNALSMQLNHSATSRLQVSLSGTGAIRNREEFQFSPIGATDPNAMPSNTPSPGSGEGQGLGDTAAQSLLFGSRILTTNIRTGFQYSVSPRLSLTGGIGGNRTQQLRSQGDADRQATGLIPQVNAVLGDIGMSYDVTARTSIGANFNSSRQKSPLQDAIITNARASVERTLTQRWFVNAYGGVGQFRSRLQTAAPPGQMQFIAGGGATYRSYAHTIMASFDRRVADIYGVGANNTVSLNGSWRWAPPIARTWFSIGFSRINLQSPLLPATTWRGTAEVGRRVGTNLSLLSSYAYMGYSNIMLQREGMFSQSAVRVALAWIP